MGNARFSDEFKRDAVRQMTERGYPVAEVSQRLGVRQHSLYAWRTKFAQPTANARHDSPSDEARRLTRELARVTEDRHDAFDYIKMFHSPTRKHVRNGLLSPVEIERQHKTQTEGV